MAADSGSHLISTKNFEEHESADKHCKSSGDRTVLTKSLQNGWQMDQKESGKKNTNTSNQPIKILKRQPNSDPCLAEAPMRTAPNRPIKTLEEREAAYAEARLRILGPSSHAESEVATNGHVNHNPRNSGATKFPAEPNVKIISNSLRQNVNGKT